MKRSNMLLALLGLLVLLASLWVWLAADRTKSDTDVTEVIMAPGHDTAAGDLPGFARESEPVKQLVAVPDELSDAAAGEAASNVNIADLAELAVLTGRVTRAADGMPVEGIELEAVFTSSKLVADLTQSTTDADGNYRFVLAEDCSLSILTIASAADTTRLRVYPDVRLRLRDTATFDVELMPGVTIIGIVVDQLTRPVPHARVLGWTTALYMLEDSSTREPDRRVTADALGRFRVSALGPNFVLTAEAPEMTCRWRLHGTLADGSLTEGVTLQMSAARHAPGRVLGPAEQPLSGVLVDALRDPNTPRDTVTGIEGVFRMGPARRQAVSDGSGQFLLGPLADTLYEVVVKHESYPTWRGINAPGDPELLVRLQTGEVLTGRVFSVRGGPVAGASIELGSTTGVVPHGRSVRTTVSDDTGRFRLLGLSPDEGGMLAVRAEDHAVHVEQPVVIAVGGRNDVQVVLDVAHVLAGVVVDIEGKPVSEASVRIAGDRVLDYGDVAMSPIPTWESQFLGMSWHITSKEGAFRFDQLYDGLFRITVMHPEDESLIARVDARSDTEDLEIVLDPRAQTGVTLSGTVRDGLTGQPVESFTVTPMIPQGAGGMSGRGYHFEDAAGFFRITGLDPGPMVINVTGGEYSPWSLPLQEYLAGEHVLDVELLATRTLHLRVVNSAREPLSARLSFMDRDGREMFVSSGMHSGTTILKTDDNGEVIAMLLPADRITVRVKTGFFGSSQDFAFDLRVEPRGVQELVFGESGDVALLVFVLTGEAPDGLSYTGDSLEDSLEQLLKALQSGSARPLDAVAQIAATDHSGTIVAERSLDPMTPDPEMNTSVPGVTGNFVLMLPVPAEPLELSVSAPGYVTERRAWQPNRTGVEDQVLVVFLATK